MMENKNSLDISYESKEEKKFQLTRGMLILGILILIIVIAIIIIIVNAISKKENEITLEDYQKLESRMEEEAVIYIMQKQIVLDSNEVKINLKDLLLENGGSIDSSKVKAASTCDGYVIASKKEVESYEAYIKCSNNYITTGYLSSGNESNAEKLDNIKPVITLKGDKKITLFVGDVYNEPGYEAIDETDGNITSSVVLTGLVNIKQVGIYTINYEVKDKSGNIASEKREIEVKNKETTTAPVTTKKTTTTTKKVTTTKRPTTTRRKTTTAPSVNLTSPSISLKGSTSITLNVGSKYNEPGYVAYDSAGTVITSKVIVISNVNVKVSGTYYITYKVTDSYGKSTSKTRIVIVKQSNVEATGISVTPNSISLSVGQTKSLTVYITPSNTTNKTLTYSSSNPSVATINNGVITGRSRGSTIITVKTSNGKTATAYVEVK